MNSTLNLLVVAMAISMVNCHIYLCPKGCAHPKSKAECDQCLNAGYSQIVHGKTNNVIDEQVGKLLKPGAYTSFESGKCWIHLMGLGSHQCAQVATHLFGDGRCAGYAGHTFELTGKCWAKFNV